MDHLVPDSFFSPPLPENMLTLPAHHRCHRDLDEEYFRAIGVPLAAQYSDVAESLYDTKVARSFDRNRALRESILSSLRPSADVYSPGGIWLGKAPAVQVDPDRFYLTPAKMVRGLFKHHVGRFLARDAQLTWLIVNTPPAGELLKLFQASKTGLEYPGVFECRYGVPADAPPVASVWWMRFWNGFVLVCFAQDQTQRRDGEAAAAN